MTTFAMGCRSCSFKKKKKKAPHPQPNKKKQTKTFLAISVTQEAFHCQWELRLGGTSSMKTAFDIAFPAVEGGLGEEKNSALYQVVTTPSRVLGAGYQAKVKAMSKTEDKKSM